MRITCLGGGPAGLYFSILMKRLDPRHEIRVIERNLPGQTFGWGVVFSDETLGYLEENDPPSHREITAAFAHWEAIDIHYRGEVVRSGGHGFSGIARVKLLDILERRAASLGVAIEHAREVADVESLRDADLLVACDGVNSKTRETYKGVFRPDLELGRCKYMWLGTHRAFDAFTFLLEPTEHGWFTVHAYRFDGDTSTFIVECHEDTWRKAGLDAMSVEDGIAYCERLFARHLGGHRLLNNRAGWINFVTVKNQSWRHENVILMGDAAHTAHFSVGSGTKMAMEDAIALAGAVARSGSVKAALETYEEERRPQVGKIQKAARESRMWFENVVRYARFEPTQLAFSLLTRSRRISFDNLKLRDPGFAERVAAWFAAHSAAPTLADAPATAAWIRPHLPAVPLTARTAPPLFTALHLREMHLVNRVVVSPMCMYSAVDGMPDDFHLVHLGSRAMGGAGLVFTEMTDVSPEARITLGCAGMWKPEHAQAWKRIVDFVHQRTRARICLQLAHAGRKAASTLPWQGDEPLPETDAWPLVSASPIAWTPRHQVPREMDRDDMDRVRDQFVRATRLAIGAGFDMIELHMAHGYLLSSFLSPLSNRRLDEYGGEIARRLRYPLEVFDAVRAAWPSERPMSVRISATDWVEGGFSLEDLVAVGQAFREHGLDILHVSAGSTSPDQQPLYGRAFQTPYSDQVRNEAGIPTIAVGNITNADEINSILAAGRADLCALARPHLFDPYFTLRAAASQGFEEQPWPVQYLAGAPRPK